MIDTQAGERFMAAPWLGEIDPETKRAILSALVEARAPSGATQHAQEQPNDPLALLIGGTASIERDLAKGRREAVTMLTAPAVFGSTLSFFRPQPTPSVSGSGDVGRLAAVPLIIPPTKPCARRILGRPRRLHWQSYALSPSGSTRWINSSSTTWRGIPASRKRPPNGPAFALDCSRSPAFELTGARVGSHNDL